jgi:hypothetical protein
VPFRALPGMSRQGSFVRSKPLTCTDPARQTGTVPVRRQYRGVLSSSAARRRCFPMCQERPLTARAGRRTPARIARTPPRRQRSLPIGQLRFLFIPPTGCHVVPLGCHFLVVFDPLQMFGNLDDLLTSEVSVREARVHWELVQQEQADVIVVPITAHFEGRPGRLGTIFQIRGRKAVPEPPRCAGLARSQPASSPAGGDAGCLS